VTIQIRLVGAVLDACVSHELSKIICSMWLITSLSRLILQSLPQQFGGVGLIERRFGVRVVAHEE